MEKRFEVFFDGSVFRPLAPVDLEPGRKYIITIALPPLDHGVNHGVDHGVEADPTPAFSLSSPAVPACISDKASEHDHTPDHIRDHSPDHTTDHDSDDTLDGNAIRSSSNMTSTPDSECRDEELMRGKKFNPEDVIGKPYRRGMLPYGGGVTRGKISFAVSEEEYLDGMRRLRSLSNTPKRDP